MITRRFLPVMALLALMVIPGHAGAQTASEVIKKMDNVLYACKDLSGTNSITLVDSKGNTQSRTATVIQKGTDKRLMRFTSPASQAGIGVLSLPNDVMYIYLPAFGKERRISSSVKNQNFAGTDFSYDDMETKPYSDKYTAQGMKTEGNVHVVTLVPKGQSEYSMLIVRVNKTHNYPESIEYYDKRKQKIKVATYTFEKVGKYWNAAKIEMADLRKDHKTIIRMDDVKYDTGLSDDEFTVRKLKQA